MKKGFFCWIVFSLSVILSLPCLAEDKTYRIEVLQVTANELFQNAYESFIDELQKNGITEGKNLTVNRTIVEYSVENAGLWKKIRLVYRIRSEAARIAGSKPDLVLTIGTPATKYAKDKIVAAGIPLVFTTVAIPTAAGCKSLTEAGPGFTGSTIWMNMDNVIKIMRLAFPKAKTIGIIHSDDDNAIANVQDLKKSAPSGGFTVISKQIGKNEHITPYAQEMSKQGVDIAVIPLDVYFGMRNLEPIRELQAMNKTERLPSVSLVYAKSPGSLLYIGADAAYIGTLSGQQAVKILKHGIKPESLPVLHQKDLGVLVDTKQMKILDIELPLELLMIAKAVE